MREDRSAMMLRARAEVAPVLRALIEHDAEVVSFLGDGERMFRGRLREADPDAGFVLIEAGDDDEARAELLARSRCILHAMVEGWRIEFVCANPTDVRFGAKSMIRLAFPEVLSRWQRAHARTGVAPGVPLRCLADGDGVMPFEALMVDVGPEGVGFLIHPPGVMLEPGTVLKGCVVEIPGQPACKVDLEVRYSQPVRLGDGSRSVRSGCRFVDPGGAAKPLIDYYVADRRRP